MAEATWNFDRNAPVWRLSEFDPFPAYAHDREVVLDTVELVQAIAPPIWDVDVFIANREGVGRTNAFASCNEGSYVNGEWDKTVRGKIVLNAKRIQPHPAMTRHLVGHEYGHNVQWMLTRMRGAKHAHDWALMEEYAALRGAGVHAGTGGTWHASVQEVFACDFRMLVCDLEHEYWPHPGIDRPEDVSGLAHWWAVALGDLAEYPTELLYMEDE